MLFMCKTIYIVFYLNIIQITIFFSKSVNLMKQKSLEQVIMKDFHIPKYIY